MGEGVLSQSRAADQQSDSHDGFRRVCSEAIRARQGRVQRGYRAAGRRTEKARSRPEARHFFVQKPDEFGFLF